MANLLKIYCKFHIFFIPFSGLLHRNLNDLRKERNRRSDSPKGTLVQKVYYVECFYKMRFILTGAGAPKILTVHARAMSGKDSSRATGVVDTTLPSTASFEVTLNHLNDLFNVTDGKAVRIGAQSNQPVSTFKGMEQNVVHADVKPSNVLLSADRKAVKLRFRSVPGENDGWTNIHAKTTSRNASLHGSGNST